MSMRVDPSSPPQQSRHRLAKSAVPLLVLLVAVWLPALAPRPAVAEGPAAVWDLGTLAADRTYPTSVTASNQSCRGKHRFSIAIAGAPWLQLAGPATIDGLAPGQSRSVPAVVDPRGLAAGVHAGTIAIRCLDCPPPPKCQQDLVELTVRLTIAAPAAAADVPAAPSAPPGEAPSAAADTWQVRDRGARLVAEHTYLGRTLTLEVQPGSDGGGTFSAHDPQLGVVVAVRFPSPVASFMDPEAARTAGDLEIGAGLRGAKVDEQLLTLTRLDLAGRRLENELQGREYEGLVTAIRGTPGLVANHLETDNQESSHLRLMVGPNDGRCHGACGPGCDWCGCTTRWCVCEVNLFCYVHDSCCQAWPHFFDCFPCQWDPLWSLF